MSTTLIEGAPAVAVRPHVSHTQISMFEECSLHWWLRYVMKIRKPQSIQMMTGSAIHAALADNFSLKTATKIDLPLSVVLEKYSEYFDTGLSTQECDIPIGKEPGSFKDAGAAVLTEYMKTTAGPLIPRMITLPGKSEPVPAIELELRRTIAGTPLDFVGVIDQWTTDNVIIDYKVMAKRWGPADIAKKTVQATAYAYLLDIADSIESEFHICVRDAAKPKVQIVPCKQTKEMADAYFHRVRQTTFKMRGVALGEIEPDISSGFCNDKLCQHYCECKDWQYGRFDMEAPATNVWQNLKINEKE